MKIFHFNDDWFDSNSIAHVRKFNTPSGNEPHSFIVTIKHTGQTIPYNYKDEKQRNNQFSDFISAWRHSYNQ